jgi:hypothetical protein
VIVVFPAATGTAPLAVVFDDAVEQGGHLLLRARHLGVQPLSPMSVSTSTHASRAEPAKFRAMYKTLNQGPFYVSIFFYNNNSVTIFQN